MKALAVLVTVLALAFPLGVLYSVEATVGGFALLVVSSLIALVGIVKVWSRVIDS